MYENVSLNWSVANPRLWYRDDLVNHPELIPLEGQSIPISDAELLSTVYTGSVLLTDKITKMKDTSFVNDSISMSVDVFDGLYTPSHLFGDPISLDNIAKVSEQWLTGDPDTSSIHSVAITFKEPTVITEYWMIAAVGTAEIIDQLHPAPCEWVLLGSNDGTNFETIEEYKLTGDNPWKPWEIKVFKVHNTTAYKHITIFIHEWFKSEVPLSTGLKRLWVFGRPEDQFILPELTAPNDSFAWVVPYKSI